MSCESSRRCKGLLEWTAVYFGTKNHELVVAQEFCRSVHGGHQNSDVVDAPVIEDNGEELLDGAGLDAR